MTFSPNENTFRAIAEETQINLAAWNAASELMPCHLRQFTADQQHDNQCQIELLFDRAREVWVRKGAPAKSDRVLLAKRARLATSLLLLRADDPAVHAFMKDCEAAAEEFVKKAKVFDPSLPLDDILQALRNQWVFNSIQRYLGHPVSVTPSSFAYSMLYPYTDNSLDGDTLPHGEAQSFLQWLSLRLGGTTKEGSSALSGTVGRLLEKIEAEYPRSRCPSVYASLLAIHRAQERSLSLRRVQPGDSEDRLLAVSIEKGGTSVLADGFLVTGFLTPRMIGAMYAYGVILQLIDDLQDLREDRAAGCSTPFTRALGRHALERATNRLFAYLSWCVSLMRRHAPASAAYLTDLIEQSCSLLILEAVASHATFYDQGYVESLQTFMPLPVDSLATMHQRAYDVIHENNSIPSGEPHYAA